MEESNAGFYHTIERATPPSTPSAAPLVAEESGLAINVTSEAYFIGCGEAPEQREDVFDESLR